MPSSVARDVGVVAAVGRVVLQQVGEGVRAGQVVDGDDLEQVVEAALLDRLEDLAADPAEAVDRDPVDHRLLPSRALASEPSSLSIGARTVQRQS